jgi:DNA-directed RNA polymerase subunit M/transcription elongation factor TFIIS
LSVVTYNRVVRSEVMIAIKGRRRCENCGKKYYYTYAKGEEASKKAKFKGKDENASQCTDVKILSMHSYKVTVICPGCGKEEIFIYTD